MVIINDPVDPDTQVELKPNTSLPQTSSSAPVSHPDPATALELLKRDFHSFREQAAKERAEAEAYRVRIAELEKEQSLLRAALEHRNVYNDRSDCAARIAGTPDSLQNQTGPPPQPPPTTSVGPAPPSRRRCRLQRRSQPKKGSPRAFRALLQIDTQQPPTKSERNPRTPPPSDVEPSRDHLKSPCRLADPQPSHTCLLITTVAPTWPKAVTGAGAEAQPDRQEIGIRALRVKSSI
ncbi:hypothetical protein ACLB2K_017980 [Fragaria x ananassa]